VEPAGQYIVVSQGVAVVALQNEPDGHSKHAVTVVFEAYQPDEQVMHVVAFARENWPGMHCIHSVAADVFEKDPAGHAWQAFEEFMPTPVEYVP
jgi:hypothetical protein